jgi:hypothetical protein
MASKPEGPDPEVHYEVDIMTLDYFCYRAIQAILKLRNAELKDESHETHVEIHISLVSSERSPLLSPAKVFI